MFLFVFCDHPAVNSQIEPARRDSFDKTRNSFAGDEVECNVMEVTAELSRRWNKFIRHSLDRQQQAVVCERTSKCHARRIVDGRQKKHRAPKLSTGGKVQAQFNFSQVFNHAVDSSRGAPVKGSAARSGRLPAAGS